MTTAAIDHAPLDADLPDQPRQKKLKGEDVGIPVRKVRLTYGAEMPTLWFANNGFLTAYFAAFSAAFPEGEGQFIYSVRLFQDKITDPVLQAQVRAFIGQEAHHSQEHDRLNNTMIERGFPLQKVDNTFRWMNRLIRKYQSPADQLAGTVCGEHLTALMAHYALAQPEFLEMVAEPTRTTWAWHAIEELEHKAVAFDVYDQLVGDRKRLRQTMVFLTVIFVLMNTFQALRLMRHTGQLTNWKKWREAFGVLGHMWRASKADCLDFYKDDYHPWQHDSRELLKASKLKYLGEGAEPAPAS